MHGCGCCSTALRCWGWLRSFFSLPCVYVGACPRPRGCSVGDHFHLSSVHTAGDGVLDGGDDGLVRVHTYLVHARLVRAVGDDGRQTASIDDDGLPSIVRDGAHIGAYIRAPALYVERSALDGLIHCGVDCIQHRIQLGGVNPCHFFQLLPVGCLLLPKG